MDNKEILEKAIQKAIDGGWSGVLATNVKAIADEDIELLTEAWRNTYHLEPVNFIFNHDFAKALWGEREEQGFKFTDGKFVAYGRPGWRHHLQQMVISEDPIKYLGDNLND